ncbi:hypothetical protein, partial [Streptomyces diastaticus]|uniref:hypothetical protein n=1 Tax=Streptomyces diastaticus TaxID=1956 RepID=UPI003654DFEF
MTHPTPAQEGTDPFGTARRRRTVLDSWAASPARFREDANAEEDLVLGGYRDRLVVELAQNAADQRIDRVARIVYVDTWPLPEGMPNNDELPAVDGT